VCLFKNHTTSTPISYNRISFQMISVALCTYNGEKYITSQIESILNQSLPVDEIVVCDDGSSDSTLDILNAIKDSCAIKIHIHQNKTNLGVCANFEQAISLCQGDVIFLSDQDDIWEQNKVQTIVYWFNQNKDKSAVFTDAKLITEDDNPFIDKTLWDCIGFNKKMRKYFDKGLALESFFINKATGATMAIRKELQFSFAKYCNNDNVLHDYCIALKALDNNKLGYIDKPLIKYRIHSNQQAGISYQLNHPEIFGNILRPLCNIPSDFCFKNELTVRHAKFGHKRASFTFFNVFFNPHNYIQLYKTYFLRFYLYDLVYKIRAAMK